MEKVYFRDNKKATLVDAVCIMGNVGCGMENMDQLLLDREMLEKVRKIFVNVYSKFDSLSLPDLTLKVVEECNKMGIEVDENEVRKKCVESALWEYKFLEGLSAQQKEKISRTKASIENSFVYDFLYEYFENNLKKTIVSEMFKKIFLFGVNPYIVIKVSAERIEKIFENETITNKESFLIQQFNTWAIYNQIIPFVKCEVKEREDNAKDIIIYIDIIAQGFSALKLMK